MKILHVVPGLGDPTNGIAVAAKEIAAAAAKSGVEVEVVETRDFVRARSRTIRPIEQFSEVWVHSMWLPVTLRACWKVLQAGVPLVRMPHGCLDPVKVRYHLWKKAIFIPVERRLMRRAARIVATEEEEARWIESFVRRGSAGSAPEIEMLELGSTVQFVPRPGLGHRKFLFVGRMHPLKGVDVLVAAVRAFRDSGRLPAGFELTIIGRDEKGLRAELEAEVKVRGLPIRFLGEVEERVKRQEMAEADCLVLPTLSENFGLVVKESLACGVPVITTDGASIWKGHSGVTYLEGYVAARHETRVKLLKEAIATMI